MKNLSRRAFLKLSGAALLAAGLTGTLTACGGSADTDSTTTDDTTETTAKPVELYVFAAASMQESLDQVIEAYKAVAPEVAVVATYDSSGTLKTQIQEGADCDVFISAAPKQMNQLDAEGGEENTEGLDLVNSAGEQGDPGRSRGQPQGHRVL